jgi:two-component system cell cycle response regulator
VQRLLIADDSATVRALARMELESVGYAVVEASDGQQALDLALADPPDVVLLDIEMPVLDGYQTVMALKADARTADIPVVFLTGRIGSEDVVRALKLGGHDYLRKPPEAAELIARVHAALRVKQLQDELRSRADELDRVSRTDFLTGLHNRRHMEEHLRMLGAGAKRHGYPLAVMIVDVDHSRRSTTPSATRSGTRSSRRSPGASARPCAPRTWSAAGAARSSSCCCPSRRRRPPPCSPNGCVVASARHRS